ncbi:hypothetical protein SLS63_012122 [Diaporthe eres]|uniref:Uncharacterized protein n=1 Tax=Diaporthe eres TaxID=83184 RepID=A0ABR1NS67_DIAER
MAPHVHVRAGSESSIEKAEGLTAKWPKAKAVIANFYDLPCLDEAVKDVEAIFVVNTRALAEGHEMTNLVTSLKRPADKLIIVMNFVDPAAIQHQLAKEEVLDESMLPMVYINSGATFMDNHFNAEKAIKEKNQIIWPSRTVHFMAIDDIGEMAARVLLSGDRRHIGALYTINNAHDLLDSFGAARVMSEAWGKNIDAVDDKEIFVSEYRALMEESLCNRL